MAEKNQLATHLTNIGITAYYGEHSKVLEEMCPSGNFTSTEWNEASVEAILKAVAVMIEENNILLQAGAECPKAET